MDDKRAENNGDCTRVGWYPGLRKVWSRPKTPLWTSLLLPRLLDPQSRFGDKLALIPSDLSPKRDCGSQKVQRVSLLRRGFNENRDFSWLKRGARVESTLGWNSTPPWVMNAWWLQTSPYAAEQSRSRKTRGLHMMGKAYRPRHKRGVGRTRENFVCLFFVLVPTDLALY